MPEIGHVRFDERGWETGRCRMAQATAPILDSTMTAFVAPQNLWRYSTSNGQHAARGRNWSAAFDPERT